MMSSDVLSLVPGRNNSVHSQVITFIFCRNDGRLLHIRFFCGGYYILFWSLQKLQRDLHNH